MKNIKKEKSFTFKIDEETLEKFKKKTENEGITMSFIIYQAIKKYLKKEE